MDFIRAQRAQPDYNPNIRHCLYGADADLIMLGLATHEAHFSIIREVVIPKSEKTCTLCGGTGHVASECTGENDEDEAIAVGIQKPFQILSIPIMRQYLQLQFGEIESKMPAHNPYNFEKCIDDFVFMCFFVGNDFLPHLPSLSIRDGSIDQMLSLYNEILPTMDAYLSDCGKVNLPQVEQFLEYLGGIEDQVFKNRLEREAKQRKERDSERAAAPEPGAAPAAGAGEMMGSDLAEPAAKKPKAEVKPKVEASDTNAWHAQLLAQSFSMDLDDLDSPGGGQNVGETPQPPEVKKKPLSGKFVDREFHQALRDRIDARGDLGEAMADTVRLGEGPHWKQRYYFEKFKVKQDDLVDFLQRIRKAYIEGLCWVLVYYYQGCKSWTWFYPYHYAPFASDLIGCANLKCSAPDYFQYGTPFVPFQQLMSVLPPVSSGEAGIPKMMRDLMMEPFSPIIDFYPADFGLDLNGKRFTWQAVILLPFIDEPRLVRILAPLLKQLTPNEKVRNRRGQELIYFHKDDKIGFKGVQLAQAAFEAGHTGLKQQVKDNYLVGFLEGWQGGGGGRTVASPIEGLPDVEESHCMTAMYRDPDFLGHQSILLPGIVEQACVINAADMDEGSRLKGFGGEPAKRMILQALGKDPKQQPKYKDMQQEGAKSMAQTAPAELNAPQEDTGAQFADPGYGFEDVAVDYSQDTSSAVGSEAPAPPPGATLIKVHAVKKRAGIPAAPAGSQPVKRKRSAQA